MENIDAESPYSHHHWIPASLFSLTCHTGNKAWPIENGLTACKIVSNMYPVKDPRTLLVLLASGGQATRSIC